MPRPLPGWVVTPFSFESVISRNCFHLPPETLKYSLSNMNNPEASPTPQDEEAIIEELAESVIEHAMIVRMIVYCRQLIDRPYLVTVAEFKQECRNILDRIRRQRVREVPGLESLSDDQCDAAFELAAEDASEWKYLAELRRLPDPADVDSGWTLPPALQTSGISGLNLQRLSFAIAKDRFEDIRGPQFPQNEF